jgi:hypothetical protein
MFSGFNDRLAVGWSVAVSLLEKNYIKGCIMKRITDFYIKHAELIGALYCAVPVVLWFVATLVFFRFRGVYVLRLILSIVIGCPLAAYFNRHGLEMWLAKHRGNTGPYEPYRHKPFGDGQDIHHCCVCFFGCCGWNHWRLNCFDRD